MEIIYSIFIGMISSKIVGMIVGIGLQCRRDTLPPNKNTVRHSKSWRRSIDIRVQNNKRANGKVFRIFFFSCRVRCLAQDGAAEVERWRGLRGQRTGRRGRRRAFRRIALWRGARTKSGLRKNYIWLFRTRMPMLCRQDLL